MQELKHMLLDSSVNKSISNDNLKEFSMSLELLIFTENKMYQSLNEVRNNTKEQVLINKVLFVLFVQGVKSYKSCLLLCMTGYYTNALMILRNIIESIFNIKYILDEPEYIYERANNYLNNVREWTKDTIKSKAYVSKNSTLYGIYSDVSNYTHSNYIGTSQNISKEGYLNSYPSGIGIKKAIPLANAVYYYLLIFLCKHYNINYMLIETLPKSELFKRHLKEFKLYNFSKRYY